MSTQPPRRRRTASATEPARSRRPSPRKAATAELSRPAGPPTGDELDAAILRFLRRYPNQFDDLSPLAEQLAMDPFEMQLVVERLARRRLLTAPFIEPGRAGGGELTQAGLRWLVAFEGGQPKDKPTALQPATARVRAEDEAARLPRAQVYGTR
ncbi:MAG TPA: hypothetical protein VFX74_00120 [Candidatus Limnocylindria bacterium]|nr:hypothetical protein [Candidatus Limnocylindria bacterium]